MNLRNLLFSKKLLNNPVRRFTSQAQQMDNDGMLAYLQDLRKNCADQQKLASIDQTIDYLKSVKSQRGSKPEPNQQQPTDNISQNTNSTTNAKKVRDARSKAGEQELSPSTSLSDAFNVFDDMRRSFEYMENAMNKAFFGNRGFQPLLSRFHDEMARDMGSVNRRFNRRFLDNAIGEDMRQDDTNEDLFEKYKIDEKVPEDAVGVSRHVEKHTVNGKTTAKARVDYVLKDGRKVSKVREFLNGEPVKELKE